ncbi:unnamed protein product [Caenorhabditis brenneri]
MFKGAYNSAENEECRVPLRIKWSDLTTNPPQSVIHCVLHLHLHREPNMNRFPLLRLPYVALCEVVVTIDKSDVFNLALSSRKMCRFVNTTRNPVSMWRQSEDEIDGLGAVDRLNMARVESLENSGNIKKNHDNAGFEEIIFAV